MVIKYDDGILKIDYKGNNPEGILELIIGYEESKYVDYQVVQYNQPDPMDYFNEDVTGHMHE